MPLAPEAEPTHPGLRAAVLADAEPAYQAMGWPIVVSDGRAELEADAVLYAREVPQAAGMLAACWWRHGGTSMGPARGVCPTCQTRGAARSRIPAPASADSDGQRAVWVHLPGGDIELACPVVLLGLLARAVTMTRGPGCLSCLMVFAQSRLSGRWPPPAAESIS